MSRSTRTLIVLAVIVLVGLVVYMLSAGQIGGYRGPVETIVLGAEPVPPASPVWIAENKGYFKEQGLDVRIREFESGRTALFTMVDKGGIDIATAAQTPVVSKSFKRNDYAIVAGMAYSDNDVKLLARRDRGIRVPQDLRGKRVGVTYGSSGHFFLGLFLAENRLRLSDVRTIDIEATRLSQALIEGQVDAIATWEPHIYRARSTLGDSAVLLPSKDIYREDFYFIARKEFIDAHPEALERFLRAIEKAEQFISKNKTETVEIVQHRLDIDQHILDANWDDFKFALFLDQSILASLEDEARWAMNNRLTDVKRLPNYLDYIYTDALQAVRPDAVTIAGKQE